MQIGLAIRARISATHSESDGNKDDAETNESQQGSEPPCMKDIGQHQPVELSQHGRGIGLRTLSTSLAAR